jgi:hypothetical protein
LSSKSQTNPNPPKKFGNTKQGYFHPENPDKYIGEKNNIIFRSSWEHRFMRYVDKHPRVIAWTSEPDLQIKYFHPIKKKEAKYYPDFLMRVQYDDGNTQDYLVEIKPKKYYPHTLPNGKIYKPVFEGRKTKKKLENYNYQLEQYLINNEKMKAAKALCNRMGKEFLIVDEDWIENHSLN